MPNHVGTGETNVLEIQLPRWRNRVDIYEGPDNEQDFLFTIRIDRFGFIKNCKRRLGIDYRVLHIKSDKPGRVTLVGRGLSRRSDMVD